MPYYNHRYNYRRRRRLWRQRARKTFRTRHWRRKPYYRYRRYKRVRNKKFKLPYLRLKEWQPPYINKLKIQGIIPLFITTSETLVRNFSMYWYENAPHYVPGGGGFSIICFTLSALYQLFEKCQCYWTRSNTEMPLIRFTGGTLKMYRSSKCDYVTAYHSCFPMKPTLDTYNSTHPSILTLNKRHKIIPCKENNHYKKPYKRIRIRPPAPIKSRWFFQQELADIPLCMLMTSSMSLDRYYSNSSSISTTMGFLSLNTNTFQYHNWELNFTSGYKAADKKYLWGLKNGTVPIERELFKNLIFLGDTKNFKEGRTIIETKRAQESFNTTWNRYIITEAEWGNPFEPKYLTQEVTVLISNLSPSELSHQVQPLTEQTQLGQWFTTPTEPLLVECRYNPYQDNGNNHIFITQITKREQLPWQLPTEKKYEGNNFPLWLSTWGFTDYMKNTIGRQVDTDYVVLIVTDHINSQPKLPYYLPIDEDFIKGRTKYRPPETRPTVYDQLHWHPKTVFQLTSINAIGASGPATVKLPPQVSTEAHCRFTFYFKLGGCGPTANTIDDPKDQPTFPTPNNILSKPSLQSPTYPLQHFIYSFDKRRDYFTERATKRMQKIFTTEKTFPSITDSNYLQGIFPTEKETSESSDEETTQTKTLLQQLQQQKFKQQQFRQRILHLISQLNT